jgi:hypothetical protein
VLVLNGWGFVRGLTHTHALFTTRQTERWLAARGLDLVWGPGSDNDEREQEGAGGGGAGGGKEGGDPRVELVAALAATNLLPAFEELG